MTTTRRRLASEVAHECFEGVLALALERDEPVPDVVLPPESTASRVINVLRPGEDAVFVPPDRLRDLAKTLDEVPHVDPSPRKRAAKRKAPPGKRGKFHVFNV